MMVKYYDVEDAILYYLEHLKELDDKQLHDVANSLKFKEKSMSHEETKEQLIKQIVHKEKELDERMDFIFQKYEQCIYTDEIFLQRKAAIDKEREELKTALNEIKVESVDEENVPVKQIRENISSLLQGYKIAETKDKKNAILRLLFHEVKVKILKKGHGRTPAEFNITPILRYNVLEKPL
jgi:hypothetical protein